MEQRSTEMVRFLLVAGLMDLTISRTVHLARGPLYRVEGSHISISCNVTGYEGTSPQEFEWSMVPSQGTTVPVGVVSMRNPEFPKLAYAARVRAGEVYIHRVSSDSAELHLTDLQSDDDGEYECYTPSTERRHLGTYSARVHLKVLPDALQLSGPSAARSHLTAREGEGLAVLCRAAAHSPLHTHLSVSFSRDGTGGGRRQMVIGLGHDLSVEMDSWGPYRARYKEGEIGVEKFEGNSYLLKVDHLKAEDSGSYFCTAAQWIQDPDRRWQKILERTVPLLNLSVELNDLTLGAKVSIAPLMFYRGDTVDLHCNVTLGSWEEEVALEVGWWAEGEDAVALVDRRGVSLPTALQGKTVAGSELSTDKAAPLCFRLRLHRAGKEDQGRYHCEVTGWAQNAGKRWYKVATARSEPVTLYLYLTPYDTLLIPMVIGVATSLIVTITIIAAVTCCFLRRLAKK